MRAAISQRATVQAKFTKGCMNTAPIHIGRRVTLQGKAETRGSVIDFEPDDTEGREQPFPYLVEWDDNTMSWHRWYDLAPC